MQTVVRVYCFYCPDDKMAPRPRSRLLLRRILGIDGAEQLSFGEHGKPYIKDRERSPYEYFSLSDEDGLTVLAVSEKEIGADVHQVGIDDEAVIRRYFTEREYEEYMAAPEAERPLLFGYMWSRIEASLKCIGTGLDLDFRKHRDMIDGLFVRSRLLPRGYVLSCACESDIEMQVITLPDDYLEREDESMAKDYTILTLSPGSTSTKVAIFNGEEKVFKSNVTHDPAELKQFDFAGDQLDYRIDAIMKELDANGVKLEDMDAFSGYCGGMGPCPGGIYLIDEKVCYSVLHSGHNHPAILGAPILYKFGQQVGKPAYAVNQPDTDELQDVARITGYPGVYRKSHVHCLNQKECAIRCANELGKSYEDVNVIVAHVGGGLSVAAHQKGKMVDTNDVLEGSGPFAPNRSGDVPAKPVASICFSGKSDKKEVMNVIGKTGGLVGLTGTDNTLELKKRITEGDTWAGLVYDTMAYQVGKAIGAFAAALKGKVDGIVLTGGVSNDEYFVNYVKDMVEWIAPVKAYGGDFEMEALASGAVRAIEGTEKVQTYTGIPSWTGFDMKGAFEPIKY